MSNRLRENKTGLVNIYAFVNDKGRKRGLCMSKILVLAMVTLGLFSCASNQSTPQRQVAEDQIFDANKYATVIFCKFGRLNGYVGSGGIDVKVHVREQNNKWQIAFTDCSGPMGGEYEVTFTQDKFFNLDFLADKNAKLTISGGMTLICLGQNTIGQYNIGVGTGVALLINAEAKQFISTTNKAACYVPTLSWGIHAGAEISPYAMKIEKKN
jgi:hypothetical protein